MDNLEKLKSDGIYNDGEAFLYCSSLPNWLEYAAFGSGFGTVVGMVNFVLIRNNDGIIVIPCNKITNEVMVDKKVFIPSNEINYFNVENGNMGFYKISIIGQDKCLFSFQISKNVTQNIRKNLDLLINNFECKNKEIIKKPNKIFIVMCAFIMCALIILAIVGSASEGEYFITIFCSVVLAWLIYAFYKSKKKK